MSQDAIVGQLVALNVGLPKDVDWRGRVVHTGVYKSSVKGPRMVRTLNIDGDGQGDVAGHGGPHRAVMVYQLDSYRHWQGEFGLEGYEYGQFGENFTVDGLADDEVCIGDQLQVGEALFEVSAPRVTCYRVGLRMGQPRLPSLLVSHRRPGFYLRVLREGHVEAGQPIERVRRGEGAMSVAEIDGLLYLPGHDPADVERASRLPALSPGWVASFEAILAAGPGKAGNAGLNEEAKVPPPTWPGFRRAVVAEIQRETDTVLSLRLTTTDGTPFPPALPGQFLTLRVQLTPGEPPVARSYSLSSAPGSADYRVSVKREEHGLVSGYIHRQLKVGTQLDIAAARGQFILDSGDSPGAVDRPAILISAGIGATPVLAMLYALAQTGPAREVWWVHGARNSRDLPFASEVHSLLAQLPHAHRVMCFSAPLPEDVVGRDFDISGRVTVDVLRGQELPSGAQSYICGPYAFMSDMRAALADVGVDPVSVHTEVFGSGPASTPGIAATAPKPPHQPSGQAGTGPPVTFARSGLTVPWRADFASLLELAEACDVPTRWSCRTGVCYSCEAGLVAGDVTYDPPPVDLPTQGAVLICCAAPQDELVLDL
ncbi:MAG TPA: MOSC and FAD-binding oxidoreductase domain-containing protein [Frankiaceae bacterium]|nr:MOSC and FAD-binding oxidoreductase domain-containing protein [Frankiaceae bacterium]